VLGAVTAAVAGRRAPRFRLAAGAVLLVAVAVACAPSASSMSTPGVSAPGDWREHAIEPSGVALSLPAEWLVFDAAALADPAVRAKLESEFSGARALFSAIAAQGTRVRLVFLGVDPAGRRSSTLPSTFAVVAVEPRIPELGLGFGADLVLGGLNVALEVETPVERERIDTPVGRGVRFAFDHRIVDPAGGRGLRASLDGALVTADRASFLVFRNVDAADADASAPSLEAVVSTIRDLP